jgi:hypothetical protein
MFRNAPNNVPLHIGRGRTALQDASLIVIGDAGPRLSGGLDVAAFGSPAAATRLRGSSAHRALLKAGKRPGQPDGHSCRHSGLIRMATLLAGRSKNVCENDGSYGHEQRT